MQMWCHVNAELHGASGFTRNVGSVEGLHKACYSTAHSKGLAVCTCQLQGMLRHSVSMWRPWPAMSCSKRTHSAPVASVRTAGDVSPSSASAR